MPDMQTCAGQGRGRAKAEVRMSDLRYFGFPGHLIKHTERCFYGDRRLIAQGLM
jgi:hypothetical protein